MTLPEGIVDAHVHYWDPSRLRYPWLKDVPALERTFLPNDFDAATEGCGVRKILVVEGGADPDFALVEADWMAGLAGSGTRIAGIIAYAPLEMGERVGGHLLQLSLRPLVRGVRRLLQGEAEVDFCLRPEFVEGVRMLEGFGYTMDLCIRYEQLAAVTELVSKAPGVSFILDHFGKPPVKSGEIEPWSSQLRELARLPNVSCKVSGVTTEADPKEWTPAGLKRWFEVVMESFGTERVIFGGDWPVSTLATDYRRWLATVSGWISFFPRKDAVKLFRSNAERIYRI